MADYQITIDFRNISGGDEDSNALGDIYNHIKAVRKLAPVAAATGIGKTLVNWRISRVGRDMGSSLTQEKIDVGMQMANQALTAGGLVLGGVATVNPALIIAGVASGINSLIGYAKENEQFNYNRGWENKALLYARERAGASFNRSREGR